jgi:hypothetical protein
MVLLADIFQHYMTITPEGCRLREGFKKYKALLFRS